MNKELLFPPQGIFRTIFFYVGQGESTLLIIPDKDKHQYILIDSNKCDDKKAVVLKDYLSNLGKDSLTFVNTHPHNDHLCGVEELKDLIKEVWHSGHKPGRDHEESYKKLQEVIGKVGSENVYYLRGSRDLNTLHRDQDEVSKVVRKVGEADFQVFSPAKYICDDIAGETPETRKQRIHEQCGVIKFSYKNKSILLTGDSDKAAWIGITNYYKDAIKCDILSASHHGSRTFFKDTDTDTAYEDHIKTMNPQYLIISCPKQEDSPHDHPHDDALEIYRKYIKQENIHHLGENSESVIVDIDLGGNISFMNGKSLSSISGIATPQTNVIYETSGKNTRPYYSICL